MIKRFLILILLAFCIPFKIFAEVASIELSGALSLYMSGENGINLSVTPGLDFYLNKKYHVGPIYEFLAAEDGGYFKSGMAAGVTNGFVFP